MPKTRHTRKHATKPRDTKASDDYTLVELAEETAAYRSSLPELLQRHEGEFVLIKGRAIAGVFPDERSAIREGYRQFGIVPFLVRQITAAERVVHLPNVVP